jgi:monoamine oxidase
MDSCEFVVIGAGFAGLSAARALQHARREVIVLEARERVGGRVLTEEIDGGAWLDLGGQWIGPGQDAIRALAEETKVETFPTYVNGKNLLCLGERLRRYEGTIPRLAPFALMNLGWVMWRLDAMAKNVRLEAPWESPRARELDSMTLATWLDHNMSSRAARRLLEVGLDTVFAATPAEYSLLHALFYVRSGGGLERLISCKDGAQETRFVGGAQTVANRVAGALGAVVRLRSPVRRIAQDADRVIVSGDGFGIEARRAVVAVPPALAARIEYSPPLPGFRDQLTQRMPMGSVIKCQAVYDEPFWRAEGLSGQVVSDRGPVHVTFDNSPPAGKPGILLGFIEASDARELGRASERDRRDAVIACFSRYFGDKAKAPRYYRDKAWADDEWSRGCYAAVMPPGAWTSFGLALRAPVGRVHWAGTETSEVWNGYIDGAVRSGNRAAEEAMGVNAA